MMISTAPIVQKKLIARMARNSRGMCMRRADQRDRGADDVPVHASMRIAGISASPARGRRHEAARDAADQGDQQTPTAANSAWKLPSGRCTTRTPARIVPPRMAI